MRKKDYQNSLKAYTLMMMTIRGEIIMTDQSLKLLHEAYNEALRRSKNELDIVSNLYRIIDEEMEFPEDDMRVIDSFLDGLRGMYNTRKKTLEITNTCIYISIVLMYIVTWLNATKNERIDISWKGRKKGLESELTKLLKKSIEDDVSSYIIRDRFGVRAIIWNDDSEEDSINKVYTVFENIVAILAGKSRKARKEFITWVEHNPKIGIIDKQVIAYILGIPFGIEALKDYIKKPKPNNYRTLQFTLAIQLYSDWLPGTQLEVQIRDEEMHKEAESGKASHAEYKNGLGQLFDIFKVEDFSQLHIPGFTGYQEEQDEIGISCSKIFCEWKVSPPQTLDN